MIAPDRSYVRGMNATKPRDRSSIIAVCCLGIILALVLGVGLASHLVLRHLVQTSPLWICVVLGFRHSRATYWVGLPLFLFWLILMGLIWTYLFGISHLVTGHFSPIEIVMTLVVGASSIVGMGSIVRSKFSFSPSGAAALFVIMAIFQLLCFRLSLLPSIAHH
jgi:hypothetical protein